MIKNIKLHLLSILFISSGIQAARIDTLSIESPKMKRKIETVAIIPEDVSLDKSYPVLYLLHGYGGNARTWLDIKPELPQMADRDGIIVVCPNGENSWYWDSPLHPESQFETFVSDELVNYIDNHYPTIKNRKGRAIAGFSMGGHGSLWLSIRHKETFGAAGSSSGGVDIRPFPDSWQMKKQLGEEKTNRQRWDMHTVITQLDKIHNGDLALIFDCGSDDFFFPVNKKFHEALNKRKIAHDFIIRPGKHEHSYWNNSIDYLWVFFEKFFNGYRNGQN